MVTEVSRNIKLSEEEEKQEIDLIIEGKKVTFYIGNITEYIAFFDDGVEVRKMRADLIEI